MPEARATGEAGASSPRSRCTELLAQDGRPGSAAAPRRHASRVEHPVDVCQQERFEVLAQYRADDRWLNMMDFAVRPQDGNLPPTTEQGEEVRLARTGMRRRAGPAPRTSH